MITSVALVACDGASASRGLGPCSTRSSFTTSINLSLVEATIGEGGRVDISWPDPDLPPGWDRADGRLLCPSCRDIRNERLEYFSKGKTR